MHTDFPSPQAPRPQPSLALGMFYVIVGSSSYGVLSTTVKFAYRQGYSTAEVTVAQLIIGAVACSIFSLFLPKDSPRAGARDIRQLMISGLPVGLTSLLYYASVQFIDASVAVVLLLQSVWMGVAFEAFQKRKLPTFERIFAVLLILFGTLLATDALNSSAKLDLRGLIFGFLSAISYSASLYATSAVAKQLAPVKRSQYMLYGGLIPVVIFAWLTQIAPYYFGIEWVGADFVRNKPFDPQIFLTYGLIIAIFGTIIPPIMLNKGFPVVGVGLGSILSSAELPFTVLISYTFLREQVLGTQWLGVGIILLAIFLLNVRLIVAGRRTNPGTIND